MGDSGKPFACPEIGCNQRFVNEDHLEVHRRKHEMSLGLRDLKSLDTPVIADQTPTPTRFLKNCEEVGLFNEPPNPFDALFRKASNLRGPDGTDEAVSKLEGESPAATAADLTTVSEEVVEIEAVTEQVTAEETSQQAVSSTTGDEAQCPGAAAVVVAGEETVQAQELAPQVIEVTTVTPVSQATLSAVTTQPVPMTLPTLNQKSGMIQRPIQISPNALSISGPILLRLSTGQTIPVIPPAVANPDVPIPVAISAMARGTVVVDAGTNSAPVDSKMVKQKLKNSLLTNQSQGNMGVMTQAVDVVTRQQGMVKQPDLMLMEAEAEDQGMLDGHIKRRRRNSDMTPDEKRERFLERNRAAATRCRNKRKQWVTNLQQEAEKMHSTKNHLMAEVNKLREEVAHLKQLLLAHNECPVTLRQRQTQTIIVTDNVGSGDAPASSQAELVTQVEEVRTLPR